MEKTRRYRRKEQAHFFSFHVFFSFFFFFFFSLLGLDTGILRIVSLVPDKEMKIKAKKNVKEKRKKVNFFFFGGFAGF